MAASTTKKVTVLRFDRDTLHGFVNPVNYLGATSLELLLSGGNVQSVPYDTIKAVCFVRDWSPAPPWDKSSFTVRPRQNGLWVRLRFRDADTMEGLMANNLLLLEPQGFSFLPPDSASSAQRIFVPREALESFEVLGVVGSPLTRRPKPAPPDQLKMFD